MKMVPNIKRYGLAVIVSALAFALAWWSGTVFPCLFVAVMVSGLYGGNGPGLVSIGLTAATFRALIKHQSGLRADPSHDFRFAAFIATSLLIHQLIAAKRRSDEARRQSEEYGRIVAETTTDAMFVIDAKEQIIFANDASATIFGWSVEQLRGRPLATLITPFRCADQELVVGEVVGQRRDGTAFAAEISFAPVVRDGQRNFAGFVRDLSELKQSQAILEKSESYLAAAQKLSHTGSFGLNMTTGEIYWSEETYRIGGFEPGTQPTVERILERAHPDDRQRVQEVFDDAAQRGSDWDFEHRFLFPDGTVKYVHVVAQAARNPLGQIEYIGSVTDITTIRHAEEELRRSERKYRDLIELSPDAIFVVDEAGLLVSTNPAGLEMLGCTAEEACGLDVADTYLPEDRPANRERMQQLREGRSFHFERTFLRRDGTTLPIEVSASPIRDGKFQAVLRDIRERKEAQEALRRSEFYLSEAEKLSHAGSWAVDIAKQRIVYWSAESYRLAHHDPSQPLPTVEQARTKYNPEDWERLHKHVEKTLREKTNFDLELTRANPDGSPQYIRMVGHPMLNAAGEVTEIIGTTIDITEQSLSRAALREAFERVQRSEDQLRLITDTIPTQAWRTAPDGALEFVNLRWSDYTGLTIEQARGWAWKALIHEDDIDQLLRAWGLALASGEASEVEGRVRRFDGVRCATQRATSSTGTEPIPISKTASKPSKPCWPANANSTSSSTPFPLSSGVRFPTANWSM
jgi:PAS domain S-box-containing protein